MVRLNRVIKLSPLLLYVRLEILILIYLVKLFKNYFSDYDQYDTTERDKMKCPFYLIR